MCHKLAAVVGDAKTLDINRLVGSTVSSTESLITLIRNGRVKATAPSQNHSHSSTFRTEQVSQVSKEKGTKVTITAARVQLCRGFLISIARLFDFMQYRPNERRKAAATDISTYDPTTAGEFRNGAISSVKWPAK